VRVRETNNESAIRNPQSAMRLYVEPMDAVVVEVGPDGRVRLENEDWKAPTLQERRAIIYAATNEIADLQDVIDALHND